MPKSPPPLKKCPQCGVAMQASRSDPTGGYDTLTCQRCDLVMTYKARQAGPGTPGSGRDG